MYCLPGCARSQYIFSLLLLLFFFLSGTKCMVRLLIELIGFSLYHWLLLKTTRSESVHTKKRPIHFISIVVPALSSDTHKWANKKRPTPRPPPPPPLSLARTIVRLLFIVCVCNILWVLLFFLVVVVRYTFFLNARYDGDWIVFTYSNAYRSFACSVNGLR